MAMDGKEFDKKIIPPLFIKVYNDGNEMEYVGYNKSTSLHSYRFTKSKTKKGLITTFTDHHLMRFVETNEIFNTSQVLDNHAGVRKSKKSKKKFK